MIPKKPKKVKALVPDEIRERLKRHPRGVILQLANGEVYVRTFFGIKRVK